MRFESADLPFAARSMSDPTAIIASYRKKVGEEIESARKRGSSGSPSADRPEKRPSLEGPNAPTDALQRPRWRPPPQPRQDSLSIDSLSVCTSDDASETAAAARLLSKKDVPMWTVEEDLHILQLVEQHGKRWSKIALHLPGRTDNGVRNRWNRMERAQAMRTKKGADAGYRCRRCGQPKRGHICAMLTNGEVPEGEDLEQRATALTALSAHTMQAALAEKAEAKAASAVRGTASLGPPAGASPAQPPLLRMLAAAQPTERELPVLSHHQKVASHQQMATLEPAPTPVPLRRIPSSSSTASMPSPRPLDSLPTPDLSPSRRMRPRSPSPPKLAPLTSFLADGSAASPVVVRLDDMQLFSMLADADMLPGLVDAANWLTSTPVGLDTPPGSTSHAGDVEC